MWFVNCTQNPQSIHYHYWNITNWNSDCSHRGGVWNKLSSTNLQFIDRCGAGAQFSSLLAFYISVCQHYVVMRWVDLCRILAFPLSQESIHLISEHKRAKAVPVRGAVVHKELLYGGARTVKQLTGWFLCNSHSKPWRDWSYNCSRAPMCFKISDFYIIDFP